MAVLLFTYFGVVYRVRLDEALTVCCQQMYVFGSLSYARSPWIRLPHRELLCVVRAMLKKMERRVYVGDTVHLSKIDWIDGRGVVEDIVPRETLLEEPAIANVNHILLVFAADRPEFSPEQASRFVFNRVLLNIFCVTYS